MASHIGRRRFLATLGGAAVAWPLAARAQQAGKLPTIGVLGSDAPSWSAWTAAFAERLSQLGWIEGRTIATEYRWPQGRPERIAEIAVECVLARAGLARTFRSALTCSRMSSPVRYFVVRSIDDVQNLEL
jgi:hypothetical protein